MDGMLIDRVRRFNREVTQRIGALDDHYLARDRPLGESRVLWEIGEGGSDVRRLRTLLDLDSGYLSRLLRSLEAAGLVTVAPGGHDRRVRTARLTAAGKVERDLLDRRSDELAWSLLDPLTPDQRDRLVAAMGDVSRLLTAALVGIDAVDPDHPHADHCLTEYAAELDRRFAGGFDPARSLPLAADDLRPPAGVLLVAALRSEPVGCGALRFHGTAPALLKRMWVAPAARGLGVGRRLLRALEERAAAAGCDTVHLDTNGALTEAIALYRSSGYREVPAFNDEPYADHWFERRLDGLL
ncbi:MAG TPA: helix-turn-helix domain-containing GNAT family N-acetyltransferase [Acidimicrobiales bacterium]|nr:helix-turn-helix domain-containing GNAT family N-acetyltransferase [Acidimicrobiales bacterium]